jgi:hypothetical protein
MVGLPFVVIPVTQTQFGRKMRKKIGLNRYEKGGDR